MSTVTESMVKSRLSKFDNPEATCTFVRKFLLLQEKGVVRISSIRTFVIQSLDVLRSGYFLAWSAYSHKVTNHVIVKKRQKSIKLVFLNMRWKL